MHIGQPDIFMPKLLVLEIGGYVDDITGHIFAGHVIRITAADVQPLPLPDGVINRAVSTADQFAVLVNNIARLACNVLAREFFYADFADKTYPL